MTDHELTAYRINDLVAVYLHSHADMSRDLIADRVGIKPSQLYDQLEGRTKLWAATANGLYRLFAESDVELANELLEELFDYRVMVRPQIKGIPDAGKLVIAALKGNASTGYISGEIEKAVADGSVSREELAQIEKSISSHERDIASLRAVTDKLKLSINGKVGEQR